MKKYPFHLQKIFAKGPLAEVSLKEIASLYDISYTTAYWYLKQDIAAQMLLEEEGVPAISTPNTKRQYYLTLRGFAYLHEKQIKPST